jgi:hypothetical protein
VNDRHEMLLPTLIAIPLLLIWVLTLVDIVRRPDLGGGSKVLWIVVTFLVPLLGPIVYWVARPGAPTQAEQDAVLARTDGAHTPVPSESRGEGHPV